MTTSSLLLDSWCEYIIHPFFFFFFLLVCGQDLRHHFSKTWLIGEEKGEYRENTGSPGSRVCHFYLILNFLLTSKRLNC